MTLVPLLACRIFLSTSSVEGMYTSQGKLWHKNIGEVLDLDFLLSSLSSFIPRTLGKGSHQNTQVITWIRHIQRSSKSDVATVFPQYKQWEIIL